MGLTNSLLTPICHFSNKTERDKIWHHRRRRRRLQTATTPAETQTSTMAHLVVIYGLILCLFFPCAVHSLASSTKGGRPIKKIAVIGTGVAGLGVAHALTSLSTDDHLELSLFDARSGQNTQDGAGIQLNGGLTALGKINRDLQQKVMDAGLPAKKVESRAKAWNNPSSTSYDTLLQLDLENLVRNAGDDVTAGLVQDGEVLWYGIMRGALQVS